MPCERPVAAVVARYCHDGPGAVTRQNVIAYIYRYLASGKGVHRVSSGENSRHFLRVGDAFALRALFCRGDIFVDGRAPLRGRQPREVFMFGSQHHEGHAVYRVGARGEYLQLFAATDYVEEHLRSGTLADPAALYLLQRFAPGQIVEPRQQSLGVGAHPQQPLHHALLLDGMAAALAQTVLHLVVGQHRPEGFAPVHHRRGTIGQTVVHQHVGFLRIVHGVPLFGCEVCPGRAGCPQSLVAVLRESLFEFRYGPGLVAIEAIIALEHLHERPLRPLVIGRIARLYASRPVVAEAQLVQLLAIARDVGRRGHGGMLSRLNGVLLGGKPERVEPHRMQHIEAAEPLIPCIYVGSDIAQRMAHMQPRPARIGEHVEDIIFGPGGVCLHLICSAALPFGLPTRLQFSKIVLHATNRIEPQK